MKRALHALAALSTLAAMAAVGARSPEVRAAVAPAAALAKLAVGTVPVTFNALIGEVQASTQAQADATARRVAAEAALAQAQLDEQAAGVRVKTAGDRLKRGLQIKGPVQVQATIYTLDASGAVTTFVPASADSTVDLGDPDPQPADPAKAEAPANPPQG